jgi:hypothetical protein
MRRNCLIMLSLFKLFLAFADVRLVSVLPFFVFFILSQMFVFNFVKKLSELLLWN